MFPYLLVLSFIVFWVIFEQKALKRKAFWIPLTVLVLFAGMRSVYVGADSINYASNFINNISADDFIFRDDMEFGYQLFEYFLIKLTHSYFWLFTISAFFIVFIYLRIIIKYSVQYVFSIYLFITLGIYTFIFNGLRQALAMAIFSLALPYLLEKKPIKYLMICIVASFFHISAIAMIPFYFLIHLKVDSLYKFLISFFTSLVCSSYAVYYIASAQERYSSYATESDKAGGLLILSFYFILAIFLYLVHRIYKINDKSFIKILEFYICGVVFIIPIAMLGANASGPQRLINYFSWLLILLLPIVFNKIKNFYIFIIFIIFMLCYFILTTYRFSTLTPYSLNPFFEIF